MYKKSNKNEKGDFEGDQKSLNQQTLRDLLS